MEKAKPKKTTKNTKPKKTEKKSDKKPKSKKKIKLSKMQKFLLIFIAAVILIVGGSLTAISIASYKPTIAFYNVSEKIQDALKKEIDSMPSKKSSKKDSKKNAKKRGYNFIVLDDSIPLSKQKEVKKAKIIFATLDCDIRDFARTNKKVVPQSTRLLDGMPTSTKQTAVSAGDKLYAVPLLYDIYEFDVNRTAFNQSEVKSIDVWDNLETFFADTLNNDSPFTFTGGDDATLIDFIGCVVEAVSGIPQFEEAEKRIYEAAKKENQKYLEQVIDELCAEGQPLYTTMEKISSLYKARLLNQSFHEFVKKDTLFYMENHIVNTGFLKLSDHRNINHSVINEFTSIFIPGKDTSSQRTFSAPTLVGISTTKNATITEALTLLATSRQTNISYNTGLAPVQANCGIPDRQADDARFWLAASAGPNLPLSAAIPSAELRQAAAKQLRDMIRFGR